MTRLKARRPKNQSKTKRPGCLWGFVIGFIIVIVVITISLFTCSGEDSINGSEFGINITGTAGIFFTGNYMVINNGQLVTKNVKGTVPIIYNVSGDAVSCTFQKESGDGTLKVQIIKGGKIIKESETTDASGTVSISFE